MVISPSISELAADVQTDDQPTPGRFIDMANKDLPHRELTVIRDTHYQYSLELQESAPLVGIEEIRISKFVVTRSS